MKRMQKWLVAAAAVLTGLVVVCFFAVGFGVHARLDGKTYPPGTEKITVTWYNLTSTYGQYGNSCTMEWLQDGQWVKPEDITGGRVTLEAYPLFPLLSVQHDYYIPTMGSPPPSGQYRVTIPYSMEYYQGTARMYDRQSLCLYFTIADGTK